MSAWGFPVLCPRQRRFELILATRWFASPNRETNGNWRTASWSCIAIRTSVRVRLRRRPGSTPHLIGNNKRRTILKWWIRCWRQHAAEINKPRRKHNAMNEKVLVIGVGEIGGQIGRA